MERAKYLDVYLQKNGKVMGPLHGLPVSVKDSFKVKGLHHTIGFASFINHPTAEGNSALVDLLLDLGAVIYVKTNIPQTLMVCQIEQGKATVPLTLCRQLTRRTMYSGES